MRSTRQKITKFAFSNTLHLVNSASMLDIYQQDTLVQVFMDVDDFCNVYEIYSNRNKIEDTPKKRRGPQSELCLSEITTLLIFYQSSGYKCFKYYYKECVIKELAPFFPGVPSYQRFVELIPRAAQVLYLFCQYRCCQGQRTEIYFADSKKLPVCENQRIHSNKVFKNVAQRGKSSTGWFYGLKLHLIINNLGEVINFVFTPANVSDNDKRVLDFLLGALHGKCFADKGYISKFFEHFFEQGIQLITKIRKNMKNKLMQLYDRYWLRKRAVIESVNDLLMSVFDIDHTRHRNPWNAIIHALAGLCAYSYCPKKPSAFIPFQIQ